MKNKNPMLNIKSHILQTIVCNIRKVLQISFAPLKKFFKVSLIFSKVLLIVQKTLLLSWTHQVFARTGLISCGKRNPIFQDHKKNKCVANKELRTLKNEILHLPSSGRFLRMYQKTLLLIWMHQLLGKTGQISEEQRNPVFQDTKKKTNCCVANKGLQTLKLKFL